jgi:hypothetical protein
VVPIEDARIVSPSSESTQQILPHFSISASFKNGLTVPMRTSNLVASTTAMLLMRLDVGLLGLLGGRSTQVGSAGEPIIKVLSKFRNSGDVQSGSLKPPVPVQGGQSASSCATL